jgi:hypothetical protein
VVQRLLHIAPCPVLVVPATPYAEDKEVEAPVHEASPASTHDA